jgi:choline-sulfatase
VYLEHREHRFLPGAWPEITGERLRRLKAHYFGEISFIDEQIGLVLDALEEKNIAENCHLVVTSDHGDFLGDHSLVAKGPFLYDALIRVPLIVRRAGQNRPERIDSLTESVDIAPSLARWAGLPPLPENRGRLLDGADLRERPRDFALSQSPSALALRSLEEKFIHFPRSPEDDEYYRFGTDPHELNNLAAAHPDRVAALRQRCRELFKGPRHERHSSWKIKRSVDPLTKRKIDWEFTF